MELAQRLAHTVKGVSGNIAADDVFKSSAALDEAVKNKDEKHYQPLLKELSEVLDYVFGSISVLEKETEEEPVSEDEDVPVDTKKADNILNELKELLEEDYTEAENKLESLKKILGTKYKNDVNNLEKQIGEYDFDSAAGTLDTIAEKLGITVKGES